ncbi:spore germination protein [Niallia taxi]|uniref:Spore germination protein n=1 Tax=Niallia taxi TaxID=2499688 RepID=A0A437KHD3_9BACI|nr:spore germination protein [Niallia taxi]MCM3216055.1 spore germination protein [Niallia taxi]MDK8639212.1 spore germination protein [Niallia taxi]MED4037016.1 spore germination protein [Niallia taxi]MED4053168.1 spore germination protein [Niallia taxi]MED4119008.1 spore germination protein [Niallia taxi]
MPAIVGPVQIVNVGEGIVQFGDSLFISPKGNSKVSLGSGASNTGAFIITNNGLSATNYIDTSLIDQPTSANN